jgi:hypothetical protein
VVFRKTSTLYSESPMYLAPGKISLLGLRDIQPVLITFVIVNLAFKGGTRDFPFLHFLKGWVASSSSLTTQRGKHKRYSRKNNAKRFVKDIRQKRTHYEAWREAVMRHPTKKRSKPPSLMRHPTPPPCGTPCGHFPLVFGRIFFILLGL